MHPMKHVFIDDPRNLDVIKNSPDWRTAAEALIFFWTQEGRCYSSGEVAAALRTHRPDLQFMVGSVGNHIREMFHNQQLPSYMDVTGNSPAGIYPFQDIRVCTGIYPHRTPGGTEVCVYGPSQDAVRVFEFEIYIPKPGETSADAPPPDPGADPALDSPASYAATVATKQFIARVWPDSRLAVPRRALEAAAKLAGNALQGGAPVWVKQTAAEAIVSLGDPNDPDYKTYTVTNSDSRVAFHSVNGPFVPATAYNCAVDAGKIVIDLTQTVQPATGALTD